MDPLYAYDRYQDLASVLGRDFLAQQSTQKNDHDGEAAPCLEALEPRVLLSAAADPGPVVPMANSSSVPELHSNPNSANKIILDFDGHVGSVSTPAYDIDGDPTSFSQTERDRILSIWEIVSEDSG